MKIKTTYILVAFIVMHIISPPKTLFAESDSLEFKQKLDSLKIISKVDIDYFSDSISLEKLSDENQVYITLKQYLDEDFPMMMYFKANTCYHEWFITNQMISKYFENNAGILLDTAMVNTFKNLNKLSKPLEGKILINFGVILTYSYDASKINEFSRVAFIPDRALALVYMGNQFGPLDGVGAIYLLQKEKGYWIIKAVLIVWVS